MTSARYDRLINDLKSEYRPQREWAEGRGAFLIYGHFLVGVAAGGWLLSRYYGSFDGLVLSYVLACSGGLAHLVNLARPERVLNMMQRYKTSWVSRGFWGLTFFLIGGVLYLLSRNELGAPLGVGSLLSGIGDILAVIGSLTMMGYMGFVYTASKGIPFWNSTLHPVLYIAYAIRGGIAALVLMLALRGHELAGDGGLLELWIGVTAVVIVLWALEIQGAVSSGDETAKRSINDLLAGRLAIYFYGGTLVIGLVVPLILTTGTIAPLSANILAVIGLASIIGDFFMKYSSIKAGVYLPVRLPHLHR
ncbi:MAG: dimethyl sulfoxide reductase anchor subunit [Rhodospirillales bacterium]|nr:dimethyl sulfoxide reductase anchor subunit [Rhodospirillales bacterium]MDP7425030.1 dimethyl sulfoxide reductase anchor subunit [Rhodospirillales bacterium]